MTIDNNNKKGDGDAGDGCLDELHGLRDGGAAAESDRDVEYSFEKDLQATAHAAIHDWLADEQEELQLLGALSPTHENLDDSASGSDSDSESAGAAKAGRKAASAAASPSSSSSSGLPRPPTLLPGDEHYAWEDYDQFIKRRVPGSKWPVVVAPGGQILGELQSVGGISRPFQCVCICFNDAHKGRCTRFRAWKQRQESPAHVERVLCHWLFRANRWLCTADHMNKEGRV